MFDEKTTTTATPFATTLLRWYADNGRELPWRGTRDPYRIWLSEIILQQTRVEQGRAYWLRFMERWPTVEALVAATEEEVLRLWQGLGYYSRARHLHETARQVVSQGGFPQTLEGLRKLKGVGDYTAAAIGSMAFGLPAAVVDGNVYRVLARHFGIDTPINSTEGKKVFASMAAALLPADKAADYNQAIMDFGAVQCTPASPDCAACPLQSTCEALHTGSVDLLPVKLKTVQVKTRRMTYFYLRCQDQTAIHRRGAGDIWQGLWELVNVSDDPQLASRLKHMHPVLLRKGVRHVLSHRILLADFYLLQTDLRPDLPDDYIWIDEAAIDDYAIPRLMENLLFFAKGVTF